MFQTSFSLIVLFLSIVVPLNTLAQQPSRPPAKCTDPRFTQLYNSQNQDPCAVATKVGQVCIADFSIPAIIPGESYGVTPEGDKNPCKCSSVYFSLVTICSACQDADTALWNIFTADCPAVYLQKFPFAIPSDLDIPHWAFLPLQSNGSIDVAAIQADRNPDVIGTSSSQTGTSTPTPTSSVPPTTTTVSSKSSTLSQAKKAGIIAGSVVGGLMLFGGIALGYWYMLRKRSSRKYLGDSEKDKEQDHYYEAKAVPYVVTTPVDPLPEKGQHIRAQPSESSFRESWLDSEDSSRRLTVTAVSEDAASRSSRYLSTSSSQYPTLTAPTSETASEQLESRDEVHALRVQVSMLTNTVNRLSQDIAPPAYNR